MMIVSRARGRRGVLTAAWLCLFCLVLIVMLWGVELLSFRSNARTELQYADDAAAHAAARDLVTESVFALPYVGDGTSVVPIDRGALMAKARADGERLGTLSRVNGKSLTVRDNPTNDIDGDIFLGVLPDNPTSRVLVGVDRVGYDPYNPDLNAVRVKTRLPRVSASATYFVDRDVVGFRVKPPPASSPTFPAIPMVPIAILSDPCAPGPSGTNVPSCWVKKGANTWDGAILGRRGQDQFLMGAGGVPVPATSNGGVGDGIPEIVVTLTEGGNSNDNGRLVYFNPAEDFTALVRQATNGVAFGDLASPQQQPGQFLLNDGTQPMNVAPAVTEDLPPASSSLSAGGATALLGTAATKTQPATGLLGIVGQPRVWVLYSGLSTLNNTPTVNVVGFVVARVMNVQVAGTGGSGNSLTITLQPSVLVTDKAVTNYTLRDLGPRSLYNPYVE